MTFIKLSAAIALVLVFSCYASSMEFSMMNFARNTMMSYSSGTQRTVNVLKPKLKIVTERPLVPRRKNKGWFTSRRRRRSIAPKPKKRTKLTYVRQTKTYKRRTTPSNKFLEALSAIDRGVADASANKFLRYSRPKINALKNTISLASKARMYQFSRHRLGEAFFLLQNTRTAPRRRKGRSTQTAVSSFINDLKNTMGSTKFDEFMAVMGDVTLMFVIDTTGSMADEIQKAKKIAVDVINYPRENPVSYILSPFNDPGAGPPIFKPSTEGALFVDEINKLTVRGGGDCAELTLQGILEALYEGPDWGSPLYVFTDAPAKDAENETIEDVKSMAEYVGATINFFTTGSGCLKKPFAPFQEIADATSGQVLSLTNHQELSQLTSFTGSVLGGSNVISSGSNIISYRKKRSVGASHRYSIKVDDSIEKMSVSVTTSRNNQGRSISLTNPRGSIVRSGKTSMAKVTVYAITNPAVGVWTLVIPLSAGQHNYFVKSTSESNINFEYYFTHVIKKPTTQEVPIKNPLIGQQSKAIITLAGFQKVNKNSIVLQIITKNGKHIRDVRLQPDSQGMRYKGTFTPPSRPFKLKIKGQTKAGNSFERVSRNVIEPKNILLRVQRSNRDFTLTRGRPTSVTFYLYNPSSVSKDIYIKVKDTLNYKQPVRRPQRTIRPRRSAFFRVNFNTPSDAVRGKGTTALVTISINNGTETTSIPVQLIVV